MFSKAWLTYVFGRWLLLSGIAGSLVTWALADKAGLNTIVAFLIQQFILACVFWYVDKWIFNRHFNAVKDVFKFPRVRGKYDVATELDKVREEYEQFHKKAEGDNDPTHWLNEFLDLAHAVEMTERVIREQGIDVDKEYSRIIRENKTRGLYDARTKA